MNICFLLNTLWSDRTRTEKHLSLNRLRIVRNWTKETIPTLLPTHCKSFFFLSLLWYWCILLLLKLFLIQCFHFKMLVEDIKNLQHQYFESCWNLQYQFTRFFNSFCIHFVNLNLEGFFSIVICNIFLLIWQQNTYLMKNKMITTHNHLTAG